MSTPAAMRIAWPAVPTGLNGRRPSARPRKAGFLGVLSEIFLTIAVVLALFIAWELSWTNIMASMHRGAANAAFSSSQGFIASPKHEGVQQSGAAPLIVDAQANEMIGNLHVPRFNPDFTVPVVRAASTDSSVSSPDRLNILNRGWVQNYKDTAMPGQIGNFALAGHRMTYGHPFNQIADLQKGDQLIMETQEYWFVYTVSDHFVTDPSDSAAIAPVPGHLGEQPTAASITLTACHPMYSAAQRYVVHGQLSYWMDKADGMPSALLS